MGVLGAGKYLVGLVGFDELADRATLESGFFPWFVNILSSHPVLTWRAAALRNRTHSGICSSGRVSSTEIRRSLPLSRTEDPRCGSA